MGLKKIECYFELFTFGKQINANVLYFMKSKDSTHCPNRWTQILVVKLTSENQQVTIKVRVPYELTF